MFCPHRTHLLIFGGATFFTLFIIIGGGSVYSKFDISQRAKRHTLPDQFMIVPFDAICSNQIALYMRFYIPRRPAHTACVYTSPLPTFYGINHTGFRRHGRLPSMEIDYEVRSEIQLLLALVFVLVVIPCTFKYAVPVFWQLYFSGVEVRVCGFVVDKKE